MKNFLTLFSLFGVLVLQAQTQRMVLVEEFSGANCGPCASANPTVNALIDANGTKVVFVKYQVDIPSADPILYPQTSTSVDSRMTFYGVNSAPEGYQDGLPVGDGHVLNITQTTINTAYTVPSPFFVTVTGTFNSTNDSINYRMVVRAAQATTLSNLVAQLFVTETEINFPTPPGTTSEKDFHHVFRSAVPSIGGSVLPSTWAVGDSVVYTGKIQIPSIVYRLDRIELVGFVQNTSAKTVYQASKSGAIPLTAALPNLTITDLSTSPGLCDATFNSSARVTNSTTVPVTSCSVVTTYAQLGFAPTTVNDNWTGDIVNGTNFTSTQPVSLTPGLYYAYTDITNVNTAGGVDFNRMDNATAKRYFTKVRDAAIIPSPFYHEDFETTTNRKRFTNMTMAQISKEFNAFVADRTVFSRTLPVGGFAASTKSYYFDCYNATNGVILSLLTDKIDVSSYPNAKVYFDYAHARYDASTSERLQVEVSTDCGATWTSLWNKAGSTLATTTTTTSAFIPQTAAQWKRDSVSLASYTSAELLVRFKCTSAYGNNVFIDNIKITNQGYVTGIEENVLRQAISVSPNPTKGMIQISANDVEWKDAQVVVLDLSGKQLLRQALIAPISFVDITNLQAGLYHVQIVTDNKIVNYKIIKD